MNTITTGRRRHALLRSLTAAAVLAGAGIATTAAASGPQTPVAGPCSGPTVGLLGITGFDCRGECVLTTDEQWQKRFWSFSVEPRIAAVAPNSPAAGSLAEGDVIVAVDGALVTTTVGGRRMANLEPNQQVTIRYRRDGRVREAVLRATPHCAPAVDGLASLTRLSALSDVAPVPAASAFAPRVRIEISVAGEDGVRRPAAVDPADPSAIPASQPAAPRRAGTGSGQRGYLGFNFGCGPCSSRWSDGREVWTFSGPVEVIAIEAGGPAAQAGIRPGDEIVSVNGGSIQAPDGAEAFSNIKAGQPVELTVRGRDGRRRTVTVVPRGRDIGAGTDRSDGR